MWETYTGLDVTSAFLGLTTPVRELYDEIHGRGWEVKKVAIKDGSYLASASNPHGEDLEATGPTDATALGNLLVKIMRREYIRSGAQVKVGMWDTTFAGQLQEIAEAYAEAPLYEPKAAAAWVELAQDSMSRAETLGTQLKVEVVDDPSPYKTADDLRQDVTEKQHIFVTRANAHHPLWSVEQMLAYRLVHDVLGHCVGGGDWGWHGENLACAAHMPLLSESAQQALFTEALGQTAFGTIYQQWGPQKIAFLESLIQKAQEKENTDGHTPVHPSQSTAPAQIPKIERESATIATQDPNANWSSGIDPLPDNAFLWQRDPHTGVDPLDAQGVSTGAQGIDPGLSNMPYPLARQAVANAFRSALLAPRKNMRANAMHYQHLMGVPAEVDDPMAYWDTLEQRREHHNQALGYAEGAHQNFWPELQQFQRWVKAINPKLDDREVNQQSKRELVHMLTEEEERILNDDPDETMPAEEIESRAFDAIQRRLKTLTKPTADQKFDFGDSYLWHQAHYTADMYPPYLVNQLRPMAGLGRASDVLTKAALDDMKLHRGTGHHFRAKALSLGLPGVDPKMASLAWLHLNPQGSQLAVMNPQIAEALGHEYPEATNRDFFKHERELAAARDASGYVHMPLGQFSWGLWDNIAKGPGQHSDLSSLRVHNPVPHDQFDWTSQTAPPENWPAPYWWDSTQEARDQVGKDWDRHVAVDFDKNEIPWQPRTAGAFSSILRPYLVHPQSGEEIEGEPGLSLMHHVKQQLGLPSVTDVWRQDLQLGKR